MSDMDQQKVDYSYMKPPREKKRSLTGWLKNAYYKYELSTALYMLDPWEKTIFNVILISCLVLTVYTAYRYTPDRIKGLVDFTSWLLDDSNGGSSGTRNSP